MLRFFRPFRDPQRQGLLAALVLCAFLTGRFLGFGLFWDDEAFLFQNDVIMNGQSPLLFWGREASARSWPFFYSLVWGLYRWFGTYFSLYHGMSILLHSWNGVLVFRIARKLALPFPAWPAALFLLHPAVFESVSWIMQLSKLLCLTLLLVCLGFELREKRARGLWFSMLAALTSAQGLLTHFRSLALEWKRSWRPSRYWVSLLSVTAVTIYLVWLMLVGMVVHFAPAKLVPSRPPGASIPSPTVTGAKSSPTSAPGPPSSLPDTKIERPTVQAYAENLLAGASEEGFVSGWRARLSLVGASSMHYLKRVLIPLPEPIPMVKENTPGGTWPFAVLGLGLILLCGFTAQSRFLLLHMSLLTYLPASGIIPTPYLALAPVADRYLYIPLAFFLLFLFQQARHLPGKWVHALCVIWLTALVFLAHERILYLERLFQLPFKSMYWRVGP